MKRILGIIGGLLVVCIVFAAVVFGAAMFLTQDVAKAGDDFMQAIKDERLDDAYAMLGGQAADEVDLETFSGTFTDAGLASWSFSNRSVNNDMGQLDGTAEFADGSYNVSLVLQKTDDTWLIIGYNLSKADSTED